MEIEHRTRQSNRKRERVRGGGEERKKERKRERERFIFTENLCSDSPQSRTRGSSLLYFSISHRRSMRETNSLGSRRVSARVVTSKSTTRSFYLSLFLSLALSLSLSLSLSFSHTHTHTHTHTHILRSSRFHSHGTLQFTVARDSLALFTSLEHHCAHWYNPYTLTRSAAVTLSRIRREKKGLTEEEEE